MGKSSSKCCGCCWCASVPIEPDFPELQPMYPDVIDPITVVCVSFSPGGIPTDVGACIYGSRHTFTRVTAGGLAHRAGVREGDQLISVNGVNVEELRHDQVINMFAGLRAAVKMEMRRQSQGSNSSSQSMSDVEFITAHLKMQEISVITPVVGPEAQVSAHSVTLEYHQLQRNQLHHQYGRRTGVMLPGSRGGAFKGRLNSSNRSDATIAVHSFFSIPPRVGTYVVLEFDKRGKFFTCLTRGRVRIQGGSPVDNITSNVTNDGRVFFMTAVGSDLKFESAKFPGKFLTINNSSSKLELKSNGSTIESQYFRLHSI
ncbi:uncharacterized protein LOC118419816 [Branchiostoma floridae]|uniref:Uncharacterized protein LOC118419816 n=1 Tax=Branchiostoma floridae TaxID=7739 RepID=A0A9J7LGB0_BRAFL|nr:uncharacterized protein LOC118419816 [Branchiostoma floridae]